MMTTLDKKKIVVHDEKNLKQTDKQTLKKDIYNWNLVDMN